MKIGDRVKFNFARKEREGVIYRLFEKTAYIKVDFPKHKGKIVKRNIAQLKSA